MGSYSIKRLLRKPWLSIVSFVIAGALCFLLCRLSAYREEQQRHLDQIRSSYDIECILTDVKGRKDDDLNISYRYTDFIIDSENGLGSFIKDLRMSKNFSAQSTIFKEPMTLTAVTSPYCNKLLDPSRGGSFQIDMDGFFESEEYVMIVPKILYDSLSDTESPVTLSLYDPYGINTDKMGRGSAEFRIVGWFNGENRLFMPYPASQKLGQKLSGYPSTDAVSFILSDNDRVDELNEKASEVFARLDPSSLDEGKFALTVHDAQYKGSVAALEQNVKRTGYLLPIIAILGLGAGFLIGFIATRGENLNYALMRTVGLKARKLLLSVIAEQQLLPFAACVIAAAVTKRPIPALVFFLCQLTGCVLAVIKPAAARPTALLRARE